MRLKSGGYAFETTYVLAQGSAAILDVIHCRGAADDWGSYLRSRSALATQRWAMVPALRHPERDSFEWFGREKRTYCREFVECRRQPEASCSGSMACRNLPVPLATAYFDPAGRASCADAGGEYLCAQVGVPRQRAKWLRCLPGRP